MMLSDKVSRVGAREVLAVMTGTEWAIGAFSSEGQADRTRTFQSVEALAYGKLKTPAKARLAIEQTSTILKPDGTRARD